MTIREAKASSLGYVEPGTVLWEGANFVRETANLSLGVSADDILSGVVLVWSRYSNQTVMNTYLSNTFAPKYDANMPITCPCSAVSGSGSITYQFTKYVNVRWTQDPITIGGYSGNDEGNGVYWALIKVVAA